MVAARVVGGVGEWGEGVVEVRVELGEGEGVGGRGRDYRGCYDPVFEIPYSRLTSMEACIFCMFIKTLEMLLN